MTPYPPLQLHVPEPSARPGRETDFSYLRVAPAGVVRQPPLDSRPSQTGDIADAMVRVLDDEGRAVGPWDPHADPELLRNGLAHDAEDPRLRRADADRATAEEDLVLHAELGRGGDRHRAGHGSCAGRHVLSHVPPAGNPDCARLSARRHDVPVLLQRPRPGPRAADAGDVHVAPARLLLDRGQCRPPIHPGGGLGDGLGDQGRHAHRLGLDRRRLDGGARFPQRAHLRGGLPGAGDPQHRQQPVGDLRRSRASRAARRPRLPRGARQRHLVAARGRQRFPRGPVGVALGGRARAPRFRSNADRMDHLPRGRAFHGRRSVQVPAGR